MLNRAGIPEHCELCAPAGTTLQRPSTLVRYVWTNPNPNNPSAKLYICGGLCQIYFVPDTANLEKV